MLQTADLDMNKKDLNSLFKELRFLHLLNTKIKNPSELMEDVKTYQQWSVGTRNIVSILIKNKLLRPEDHMQGMLNKRISLVFEDDQFYKFSLCFNKVVISSNGTTQYDYYSGLDTAKSFDSLKNDVNLTLIKVLNK